MVKHTVGTHTVRVENITHLVPNPTPEQLLGIIALFGSTELLRIHAASAARRLQLGGSLVCSYLAGAPFRAAAASEPCLKFVFKVMQAHSRQPSAATVRTPVTVRFAHGPRS
jgi:hypothetical protein